MNTQSKISLKTTTPYLFTYSNYYTVHLDGSLVNFYYDNTPDLNQINYFYEIANRTLTGIYQDVALNLCNVNLFIKIVKYNTYLYLIDKYNCKERDVLIGIIAQKYQMYRDSSTLPGCCRCCHDFFSNNSEYFRKIDKSSLMEYDLYK